MFELKFSTDNAAFCTEADDGNDGPSQRAECARILREIARKLDAGAEGGSAIDANGNRVGKWELE